MGRGSRRIPIQKPLIPTADLGMLERQIEGLSYPDDVPLVMALQVVQTPAGPRIAQGGVNGATSTRLAVFRSLRPSATDVGAGVTAPLFVQDQQAPVVVVLITALGGAPTNIIYTPQLSLDGVSYYNTSTATAIGTGVVGIGLGASPPASGGDIRATLQINGPVWPFVRIAWAFTAGTAPSVTHAFQMLASG